VVRNATERWARPLADGVEVEIKYRLPDADALERLRERLGALGAEPAGRQAEENQLYDGPRGRLRRRGALLRLRTLDGGPGGLLTFKGPAAFADGVKSRREVELAVADAASAAALLAALGYRGTTRYLKQREAWRLDGVAVALDRLAFGCFCELEGPAERLRALADRLGLTAAQIETEGYPALQEKAQPRRTDP
jgi:predicted adenylyl cyclase CyaB